MIYIYIKSRSSKICNIILYVIKIFEDQQYDIAYLIKILKICSMIYLIKIFKDVQYVFNQDL